MVVRAPASRQSPAQADERLLVAAAQKNPARFAELYEIHFERVYVFIARRVGDRDTAEDLTSEVFHKALANLKRFEWRGVPFGAWLLRIAAHAVTDRGKQSSRELSFADPPEIDTQPDMKAIEDGAPLSAGGGFGGGPEARGTDALRRTEKHSRDRQADGPHRRSGKATAVSRTGKPEGKI